MTIRLAVVSTAKNTNRILNELVSIADGEVEIAFHLGDKTAQFKASSLSRMKPTTGSEGHLMESDAYTGAAEPLFQSRDFFRLRDVFADHMTRTAEAHKYKSHPMESLQEVGDYYQILCDRLAGELVARRVTHVLFFNAPHLSYDTALYHVAKALGLVVTMLAQSSLAGHYFSYVDPADVGAYRQVEQSEPFKIEKGKRLELFYMEGIKQERESGGSLTMMAIVNLITFLFLKRGMRALNPFYVARLVRHMKRTYRAFPKWRDPFGRYFHEDEFVYFDRLAQYEDQVVDLSGDYVYFPLQLQPEMTTSALGGTFRDQAYAIERLAGILPEGVRILVKENPKQGGYMRGPMFFERLERIPSVTFLPSWADTYSLTDGSKFVAAITGTVGWEAIRAGKPALVFGKAWYRKLPGVVEWHEAISYEEIVNTTFAHESLEQAVGDFLACTHDGVLDRNFVKNATIHNEAANERKIAETLLELLWRRIPISFSHSET